MTSEKVIAAARDIEELPLWFRRIAHFEGASREQEVTRPMVADNPQTPAPKYPPVSWETSRDHIGRIYIKFSSEERHIKFQLHEDLIADLIKDLLFIGSWIYDADTKKVKR